MTQYFLDSLAVIYTATIITFTVNVQPIGLSPNIIVPGIFAQVSGWGSSTQTGGIASNNLLRLNTTIISNDDCRSRHSQQTALKIFDSKICTFTRTSEGTCFGMTAKFNLCKLFYDDSSNAGDEGGALVFNGQIIGVASFQVPCAIGRPDVFEGVVSSRLWLLSTTGLSA